MNSKINLDKIEELLVTQKLSIDAACKKTGITRSIFYHSLKKLDDEQFRTLFMRAREARGLAILDDCFEAFEEMKKKEIDGKEVWRLKAVIENGIKLAARYNQNLAEKPLVQNNTQINFGHDEFVLKMIDVK